MLVDLSRNDLSKVCVAGSVDVTQFMEVERFSHIMHLVSTVVGTLAPAAKAYDVLKATLPGRHALRRAEAAGPAPAGRT